MPKAKGKNGKKKSKKDAELSEPPHDAAWERAVESGVWDRPPDALPDASVWPTWGAYRERILTSAKEVNITWHASLRDEFAAELIKLSPPNMKTLTLHVRSLVVHTHAHQRDPYCSVRRDDDVHHGHGHFFLVHSSKLL